MKIKKLLLCFSLIFFVSNVFSESALDLFQKGLDAQNAEDYFSAIEFYRETLEKNPDYGLAWFNLSKCNYYLGNYDLAETYANEAEKYFLEKTECLNLQAMCKIALGDLDGAKKIFTSVLKKYPNDVESRFGLAELDLFYGKVSSAQDFYLQALKRDPSNRKALLSLALISCEKGNEELAQNYINQALSFHNGDREVHYFASYIACKNGDLKTAETRARSAVQISGDFEKAYALLTQILYAQKRYEDVIDLCEFRTGRNRNLSDAWYLMGLSYKYLGQNEKALECWELGLAVKGDDEVMRLALEQLVDSSVDLEDTRRKNWASFHLNKANEYKKNYDSSAQRFEFQKALQICPLDIEIRQQYAALLEQSGNWEQYLEQLNFISTLYENLEEENQIQKNENSPVRVKSAQEIKNQDSIEALESLMSNNLSRKWNVNPFYLDKSRWNIAFYYNKKNLQLFHSDLEEIVSLACKSSFDGVPSTTVDVISGSVESFALAYSYARKTSRDYFVILSANESERSFSLNAKVYSARTGTLIDEINVYRTGNDRVSKCIKIFRSQLLSLLPVRGKILQLHSGVILADLGKNDGANLGDEFKVCKQGSIVTNDSKPGIFCTESNTLGTFKIEKVNEELSEGQFYKKGYYNLLTEGDELILVKNTKPEENETESIENDTRPNADIEGNPVSDEARKEKQQLLKEELKIHIKETELLTLIKNIGHF